MQRFELLPIIRQDKSGQAHAIAARYGYDLLDLTCNTPKCGNKVNYYLVAKAQNRDHKHSDDYRYQKCDKCGVRGDWSEVPTPEPKKAEKKAEPKKEAKK